MTNIIIVDGKIMAQGQEVKKITIDGMEYAINDPAAALKNLPAKRCRTAVKK